MFSFFIRFPILTADISIYSVDSRRYYKYNNVLRSFTPTPFIAPPIGELEMKQLLTLTLVTIIGFAVAGCNKTSKVNAGATSAAATSCSASADACCGSTACTTSKAKPAAAGSTSNECQMSCSSANKMKKMTKPAAAGTKSNDCPMSCSSENKMKKMTKPAAAGSTSSACDPSDCGDWKGACPMSGGK
jgi:hypothetical protein